MTTEQELIEKIKNFCANEKLEHRSADEMESDLYSEKYEIERQIRWLQNFQLEWEDCMDKRITEEDKQRIKVYFHELNRLADKYDTDVPTLCCNYS